MSQSTIFQSCRDESSYVEPVLNNGSSVVFKDTKQWLCFFCTKTAYAAVFRCRVVSRSNRAKTAQQYLQIVKRRNRPRGFHALVEIRRDQRTPSGEPPRDQNQSSVPPVTYVCTPASNLGYLAPPQDNFSWVPNCSLGPPGWETKVS